ncbi:deoxycytidylate deaminase [Mugil cephalus]|uniref:deoxycytidylate deaminase n=1 Tax=Mugil cephalus TaxID=48193 RepID=UPI001FB79825|nr:deoxycytidylate deaminase [Mugil cephalus]
MEKIQPPASLNGNTTRKRQNYLEWPEYFMAVAFLSAQRSKDPSSQVGACIVSPENKIVGIGYNGMPNGCNDDQLPWSRSAVNRLDTKYPYVCHAELNAIMNKNSADVKGCTMYVALFPCNECAKLIIQAGLKEVVYLSDKYHDTPEMTASRKLLRMARVQFRQFKPKRMEIVIDFNSINHPGRSLVPPGPPGPEDDSTTPGLGWFYVFSPGFITESIQKVLTTVCESSHFSFLYNFFFR